MKYYCKRCGSELKTDVNNYGGYCPICYDCKDGLITRLQPIPDYETAAQYEKRTGKRYPDDGSVWARCGGEQLNQFGRRCFQCDNCDFRTLWNITTFYTAKYYTHDSEFECSIIIVIADPPVPPLDEWKPEEEVTA